jgi:hypothetical protein
VFRIEEGDGSRHRSLEAESEPLPLETVEIEPGRTKTLKLRAP